MLTAQRMSMWRARYRLVADGREAAVWEPSWWRIGGNFEIDGRRFQVRHNGWGGTYRLLDEADYEVAVVERAGRKHWTLRADGRVYEFRRASLWGNQQELLAQGVKAGSIRRTSAWKGTVEADLPGLPLPLQIFVVGVQIARWEAQRAAAASS
jgi:hypothetical protein